MTGDTAHGGAGTLSPASHVRPFFSHAELIVAVIAVIVIRRSVDPRDGTHYIGIAVIVPVQSLPITPDSGDMLAVVIGVRFFMISMTAIA
jgi:hypothetical protein